MSNVCPHCGAKMKKYWHRLTPMLVNVLVKMRTKVIETGINDIEVREQLDLDKTEYNNFQKLRFHALVAKVKEKGNRKTGHWLLTKRGNQFIRGDVAVPVRVQTFRNRVVGYDSKKAFINEILRDPVYVEDLDLIDWEAADVKDVENIDRSKKKKKYIFNQEENTVKVVYE